MTEYFGDKKVARCIVVLGEGVVWYSGQFWALYYLQQVSKLDPLTTAYIVGAGLIIGTPTLIFFGWLSDHIGRKPGILGGFLLAAVTYYPLYAWLGTVSQPGNVNYPIAIIIVAILVAYVGMVYGPIGEFLAEYFPSRIRYTSVSVPYHIGNGWGGGLVPFITSAAFQATGSLGYALIYPIAVPAVCFVAVRRNHLDAVAAQLLIQWIAVVSAIADEVLWLGLDHAEVETELTHFVVVGRVRADRERQASHGDPQLP